MFPVGADLAQSLYNQSSHGGLLVTAARAVSLSRYNEMFAALLLQAARIGAAGGAARSTAQGNIG